MNAALADLWPYLVLILAGYLPNEVWRLVGLMLVHGLSLSVWPATELLLPLPLLARSHRGH